MTGLSEGVAAKTMLLKATPILLLVPLPTCTRRACRHPQASRASRDERDRGRCLSCRVSGVLIPPRQREQETTKGVGFGWERRWSDCALGDEQPHDMIVVEGQAEKF